MMRIISEPPGEIAKRQRARRNIVLLLRWIKSLTLKAASLTLFRRFTLTEQAKPAASEDAAALAGIPVRRRLKDRGGPGYRHGLALRRFRSLPFAA